MTQPFVGIVYVILLSCGQYLLFLACNLAVTTLVLRAPPPEAICTGIMASQKSGPVAVAIIGFITSDTELQGLMDICPVIGQLVRGGGGGGCNWLLSSVSR